LGHNQSDGFSQRQKSDGRESGRGRRPRTPFGELAGGRARHLRVTDTTHVRCRSDRSPLRGRSLGSARLEDATSGRPDACVLEPGVDPVDVPFGVRRQDRHALEGAAPGQPDEVPPRALYRSGRSHPSGRDLPSRYILEGARPGRPDLTSSRPVPSSASGRAIGSCSLSLAPRVQGMASARERAPSNRARRGGAPVPSGMDAPGSLPRRPMSCRSRIADRLLRETSTQRSPHAADRRGRVGRLAPRTPAGGTRRPSPGGTDSIVTSRRHRAPFGGLDDGDSPRASELA